MKFELSELRVLDHEVPRVFYWECDIKKLIEILKIEYSDDDVITISIEDLNHLLGDRFG